MYIVPDDIFNQRFWNRTDRTGDCWLWTGPVMKNGYGQTARHYRRILTHRYAYELAHGPIPEGMCVCHTCDIRRCINPNHLFLGTVADNNRDMRAKGRSGWQVNPDCRARGSQHGRAKLTESDVLAIRDLVQAGNRRVEVAAQFNVSIPLVHKIMSREIWKHVD